MPCGGFVPVLAARRVGRLPGDRKPKLRTLRFTVHFALKHVDDDLRSAPFRLFPLADWP